MPLRQVIAQVLKESPTPLSINEIMEAVKATGYQSNATNFRGVISMSLEQSVVRKDRSRRGGASWAVLEEPDETSDEQESEQDAATAGPGRAATRKRDPIRLGIPHDRVAWQLRAIECLCSNPQQPAT